MLISVIVPVYQAEHFLPKLVDSVLSQGFQDFEIILLDNAATDQSPAICERYAAKDSRVVVVHLSVNEGPSVARNLGLKCAQGEYVALLDSDDYLYSEEVFERWAQVLLTKKPDILCYGVIQGNQEYSKQLGNQMHSINKIDTLDYSNAIETLILAKKFFIAPWGKVIRRSFINEIDAYFPERKRLEDLDWSMQIFKKAHKICGMDDICYFYYQSQKSTSKAFKPFSVYRDHYEVIKKWAKIIKDDSEFSVSAKEALLGYLAYQYYILIGTHNHLSTEEKKLIFCLSEDIRWITKYYFNNSTKICSWIHKIIGAKATGKVLSFLKTQ